MLLELKALHLICLFLWGLSSNSRIFHSCGDFASTGEGLQMLTYARHSWQLNFKGSLACHTYCDTSLPFKMVISRDTHTYCLAFRSGAGTTCFYDLDLSLLRFEHPTFRLLGERSNTLRHCGGLGIYNDIRSLQNVFSLCCCYLS